MVFDRVADEVSKHLLQGNFSVTSVGRSGAMSMVKVSGGARESIIYPSKSPTDTNDFGVCTRPIRQYCSKPLIKLLYGGLALAANSFDVEYLRLVDIPGLFTKVGDHPQWCFEVVRSNVSKLI